MMEETQATSTDTVYNGRLSLVQPLDGYRATEDALLLTHFVCQVRKARSCVDMGTGCGVIGLGLLLAGHVDQVVGVEIQPRLAALCRRNASDNCLSERFELVEGDLCAFPGPLERGRFDLVVANPPFWPADSGKPPANSERRIACQEIHGNIAAWTRTASALLNQKRGRFALVYPARRLNDLFAALSAARLYAQRMRVVHPSAAREGELVLVEARHGTRGHLDIEPPLVLKNADGVDTHAARMILSGSFSSALSAIGDKR